MWLEKCAAGRWAEAQRPPTPWRGSPRGDLAGGGGGHPQESPRRPQRLVSVSVSEFHDAFAGPSVSRRNAHPSGAGAACMYSLPAALPGPGPCTEGGSGKGQERKE